MPSKNLTNQKFGRLTVIRPTEQRDSCQRIIWECLCDCGNTFYTNTSNLTTHRVQSCGCLRKELSSSTNLVGQKFGRLTVLEKTEERTAQGGVLWKCQCECGNICMVSTSSLNSHHTQSCGCLHNDKTSERMRNDLTNQKFGKLTAIEPTSERNHRCIVWKCQCDCGNTTYVRSESLTSGNTKSCGCLQNSSYGMELINKLLAENNISFVKEKTFSTCFFPDTQHLARFDFYVNNQYLLEFDGEQHFFECDPRYFSDTLAKRQEHDEIKNQWCKDNNIPLIRIPYSHLNKLVIEDLLLETSKFLID